MSEVPFSESLPFILALFLFYLDINRLFVHYLSVFMKHEQKKKLNMKEQAIMHTQNYVPIRLLRSNTMRQTTPNRIF